MICTSLLDSARTRSGPFFVAGQKGESFAKFTCHSRDCELAEAKSRGKTLLREREIYVSFSANQYQYDVVSRLEGTLVSLQLSL